MTQTLSIVTPTHARSRTFALTSSIARASLDRVKPTEWIVVCDYDDGYAREPGQHFVKREQIDRYGHGHSLCDNLATGLQMCHGNIIAILEDDDRYAPEYFERLIAAFEDPNIELAGLAPAHYYHLPSRRWQCMANREHCSLAQTAFRRSLIPTVLALCARSKPWIDIALWDAPGFARTILPNAGPDGKLAHLSLKGLPGAEGIGCGHRAHLKHPDRDLTWLRSQIGPDADRYLELLASVPANAPAA